jgi:hypothetical protein
MDICKLCRRSRSTESAGGVNISPKNRLIASSPKIALVSDDEVDLWVVQRVELRSCRSALSGKDQLTVPPPHRVTARQAGGNDALVDTAILLSRTLQPNNTHPRLKGL